MGVMLLRAFKESLGGHVDAEVDHMDAFAFEHHLDKVLSDIVQIPFDGADDGGADRFHPVLDQPRFEYGDALVHGARCDQDLRDKDLIKLELPADDPHAGEQPALKNLLGGVPFVQRLLHQLFHLWGAALLQKLTDFF